MDVCEFETGLVYRVSSGTTRDTQRNTLVKKQKNQTKNKEKASSQKNIAYIVSSGIGSLFVVVYFRCVHMLCVSVHMWKCEDKLQ